MHWKNLKYLILHKWYVFLAGIRLRVWWHQLILHDWTKLLPIEWFGYARFFHKMNRTVGDTRDFEQAWNHHQKHNKHHWQYWVMIKEGGSLEALIMPERFVREMIADWIGAGRAISGRKDCVEWYLTNRNRMLLNPVTRALVKKLLGIHGE